MFGKSFGPVAFAGPGAGPLGAFGKMQGSKCGPGDFLTELNLTDEQLLKIASIKGKVFGQIARSKIELMELKKEAFKELLQPQADKAKIKKITDQIKSHKSDCIDLLSENLIVFSEVLTPQQKTNLQMSLVKKFLGVDEILEDEEI